MKTILIVEDDLQLLEQLEQEISRLGWNVYVASSLGPAREKLNLNPDLVLCDVQLPDGSGIDLLPLNDSHNPKPGFYFMSAYGSIPLAVTALKKGALDFFEKPVSIHQVANLLSQHSDEKFHNKKLLPSRDLCRKLGILFAENSPMKEVLHLGRVVSDKTCSVFINGESGTGKELLAKFIHESGPRANAPFIALNCASIAPHLLESELFGYRKGAFTGAIHDSPGLLAAAEGGTLFLDEIGDMPLGLQGKILRALQERKILPVGGVREIPVNFRLLSATHKNLKAMVQSGDFREDLFFRINVIELKIPPLRERPMDLPVLLKHFLQQFLVDAEVEEALAKAPKSLYHFQYQGNIRQLRNLVERYSILREINRGWNELLGSENQCFPADSSSAQFSSGMKNSLCSRKEVMEALEKHGYNRRKTADYLGITRRALQYRLNKIEMPG